VEEAIKLVKSKRDPDGKWTLEVWYAGEMPVDMGESVGLPSKWNTLRALRVLKWHSAGN
jgi:hypothetical protein